MTFSDIRIAAALKDYFSDKGFKRFVGDISQNKYPKMVEQLSQHFKIPEKVLTDELDNLSTLGARDMTLDSDLMKEMTDSSVYPHLERLLKILYNNWEKKFKNIGSSNKETEGSSEKKPAEKPAEKVMDKPAEKPVEKAIEKPIPKPIEKPLEKKIERPVEKPAVSPVPKPIEKPIEKKIEKPIKKTVEKPMVSSEVGPLDYSPYLSYLSNLGFKAFLDDVVDGKLPKISEAVVNKFPELGSELNLKSAISLFYYLLLSHDSKHREDLESILTAPDSKTGRYYYKNFNGKYKSDIDESSFYQIPKVVKVLSKYWEDKVKNTNPKYTDNATPEELSNRKLLDIRSEFGEGFENLSLLPISDEERMNEPIEDGMGYKLDIGDLFFIPRQKIADFQYMHKVALLERFFGTEEEDPTIEDVRQKAIEERNKAWEESGYNLPGYDTKIKEKATEDKKPKDLVIPYPTPYKSTAPSTEEYPGKEKDEEESKEIKETSKDNKNYLRYNVFKVTDKFKRKDPYGDGKGAVPWVAGVRFDIVSNKETPYYKIKVPAYLVSSDDTYIYEYFPRPKDTVEEKPKEELEEKPKYLIPPRSRESWESIDEEIFVHEAIYESLLDIVKEAEDVPQKASEVPPGTEVVNSEGKKGKLVQKGDVLEFVPDAGSPDSNISYDPQGESLNKEVTVPRK